MVCAEQSRHRAPISGNYPIVHGNDVQQRRDVALCTAVALWPRRVATRVLAVRRMGARDVAVLQRWCWQVALSYPEALLKAVEWNDGPLGDPQRIGLRF